MDKPKRVLILGGTAEGRALAARLDSHGHYEVETSLAGATRSPAEVAGETRRGGFGGVGGLANYLKRGGFDVLIDATHPFADTISAHAEEACARAGVSRLVLRRPPWSRVPGDNWFAARGMREAASMVEELGRRVFLSIGRQDLHAFSGCRDAWFLIRSIDLPETVPIAEFELLQARGPFDYDGERALLKDHKIDCVVSKNSGGADTYAKIEAARDLGLPVIMIERPAEPAGPSVATVDEAMDWLAP